MGANEFSIENRKENVWLWLVKIISGILIIFFLAVHFIVNHLVAPGGLLTYSDVIRYYSNPIIPVMEISFLFFAVFHSVLGTRGIFLDLNPSQQLIKIINWVFIILGIGAIIYGTWLVIILAFHLTP